MKKIAVGMSGGVDSSTAAALLLSEGYEVEGIIMRLKPEALADADIADAKNVADALGIKLHILDCRSEFKNKVIEPFIGEYLSARTPNPCVECNSTIKFGAMLDYALNELHCDGIATGHYARIEEKDGKFLLKRSASPKDQSYFLHRLTQHQLAHSMFPLDGFEKEYIREYAEKLNLPVASKRDSQEICFVPDDDYIAYLASLGITSPKGNFVDIEGNILGTHNGIINYTVGQRKGLGAFGKPMFVTKINSQANEVVLGEKGTEFSKELVAEKLNFISIEKLAEPMEVLAKVRYSAKPAKATAFPQGDLVRVVFDEPQRAVTPGQAVVFYDLSGNGVVGGGIIR